MTRTQLDTAILAAIDLAGPRTLADLTRALPSDPDDIRAALRTLVRLHRIQRTADGYVRATTTAVR